MNFSHVFGREGVKYPWAGAISSGCGEVGEVRDGWLWRCFDVCGDELEMQREGCDQVMVTVTAF